LQRYSGKDAAKSKPGYYSSPRKTLVNNGFIIHSDKFLDLLGPEPTVQCILENEENPFAHEAGVYIPKSGDVFITSNQ